jgi:hypothetical protein
MPRPVGPAGAVSIVRKRVCSYCPEEIQGHLENPPEIQKAGLQAAKTRRREQLPLGGQQFNTLRTVMSNRLNPTAIWMNLHESWRRESLGRGEKEGHLDLISQDHHLGRFQERYDVISDFQAKLGGRVSRND